MKRINDIGVLNDRTYNAVAFVLAIFLLITFVFGRGGFRAEVFKQPCETGTSVNDDGKYLESENMFVRMLHSIRFMNSVSQKHES